MRAMDLQENINAVNNVKWSIVQWFLLVSYFWIIKEGLEKCISSKENYYGSYLCMQDCRGISKHARLDCTPHRLAFDSYDAGYCWRQVLWQSRMFLEPECGPRYASFFPLSEPAFLSTSSSLCLILRFCHFLTPPVVARGEREREDLSLQVSGVCSSTVCNAIISTSPSFQGSFVPFFNNRTHWFEDILVFSSAIPKNLADDPYWGKM